MMSVKTPIKFAVWLFLSVCSGVAILLIGAYLYLAPTLPDAQELREVDLQTPLRIYTEDGKLISEIGEKRRTPLIYSQIPHQFVQALLASEDDGFFQHYGIDVKGLLRASLELIRTGRKKSGGSTITMQVAKNYYLSSEKSFGRKFTEILLALKIEQALSKEEILELYVNKIYLGKRAYGIEAAAQVYYGKSINELNLAQTAMIAGLPQAPTAANPVNNPQRALERRNYVLSRMLELDMINENEYRDASAQPVTARYHGASSEVPAPYLAEMVRQQIVATYGEDDAYTHGYRVYTSINSTRQLAANTALQQGVLDYDRDHGYRQKAEIAPITPGNIIAGEEWLQPGKDEAPADWSITLPEWKKTLADITADGVISAAIVSRVTDTGAWFFNGETFEFMPFAGMNWAAPYININAVGRKPSKPSDVLTRGQKIWVEHRNGKILLAQKPEVESALVSVDPHTGGIQALVGGFTQADNQFNRVIQAQRQPGSAFKPFIYSAALANGFTPATIINDAPIVYEDSSLESSWRPENYNGKFNGPTRLRQALYRSQNLVSIRILKQITPKLAVEYIKPFGFQDANIQAELSLALGSSAVTPLQLATGYSALANGGFAIKTWFIDRVEDSRGQILMQNTPSRICDTCTEVSESQSDTAVYASRVMDPRTNFLMVSMLKDVINRGTGAKAKELGRNDLAGKTGTTNDQKDAWFSGFNKQLVTTVWVGFDTPTTLGRSAFGGTTALPIWMDYMRVALKDVPEQTLDQPEGIVQVRIDPETGLLAAPGQTNAIFEFFRQEDVPTEVAHQGGSFGGSGGASSGTPELLF
jgi:penicillin-binding protein 1A